MTHFDLGRWEVMMVLTYVMVSDGKVLLENQEAKILAPPSSCVTLKEPSVLQMFHGEIIESNKNNL